MYYTFIIDCMVALLGTERTVRGDGSVCCTVMTLRCFKRQRNTFLFFLNIQPWTVPCGSSVRFPWKKRALPEEVPPPQCAHTSRGPAPQHRGPAVPSGAPELTLRKKDCSPKERIYWKGLVLSNSFTHSNPPQGSRVKENSEFIRDIK